MRTVILAGGFGTRLAEETGTRPKPMIDIGGRPMLWHIARGYASQGFDHFVVALGYLSEQVKRYFLEFPTMAADLTVRTKTGEIDVHGESHEDWTVDLVETGLLTNTGGRLGRLRDWLPDETFFLTYGDGVSDVDLRRLLEVHRRHGRIATITAVRPPARFGGLVLSDDDAIEQFNEKPQIGEGWINGGFMVFERAVLERIEGDDTSLEADVLEGLARDGELTAYRHDNFWQCMDTLRDVRLLRGLWDDGDPPWPT